MPIRRIDTDRARAAIATGPSPASIAPKTDGRGLPRRRREPAARSRIVGPPARRLGAVLTLLAVALAAPTAPGGELIEEPFDEVVLRPIFGTRADPGWSCFAADGRLVMQKQAGILGHSESTLTLCDRSLEGDFEITVRARRDPSVGSFGIRLHQQEPGWIGFSDVGFAWDSAIRARCGTPSQRLAMLPTVATEVVLRIRRTGNRLSFAYDAGGGFVELLHGEDPILGGPVLLEVFHEEEVPLGTARRGILDDLSIEADAFGEQGFDHDWDGVVDIADIFAHIDMLRTCPPGACCRNFVEADRPVILSNLRTTPAVAEALESLGVRRGHGLNRSSLDPDDIGLWGGPSVTGPAISGLVEQRFDGYLMLDWEGEALRRLRAGPSHPGHAETSASLIEAVTWIRAQLPGARVGFYNLPVREYWDQSEQWREAAFAAKPVTDAANALFPTVYDFYAVSEEADHRRFATNIELTLEVADGRPVILYTWARYHPSNPDLGRRLIPELEYHNHVGRLMAVEHEGVRPHGAVAWGPDYAWLERAFTRNPDGSWTYQDPFSELLRSIFLAEMPEDLTPDDWQLYADRLAIDTFLRIFDALDGR